MDPIGAWRYILIGAIAAAVAVIPIGGLYFWYMSSKAGTGSASDTAPTPVEQRRRALDSFTAPAPTSTSPQATPAANPVSPQTPPEFDAPAASPGTGAQVPDTPSSFDAPSS